ncbi:hypothetical protein [Ammoniphilus sp. 3BR4]|uniref:hypothetical protein n=1 Tax=Ammoniphilus sp. 3BR4 TaxID=3158265 RepID=UPI0034655B96
MPTKAAVSENRLDSPKQTYPERVDEVKDEEYLEILGDTVLPANILYSVLISLFFSLGGFFIGKRVFPLISSEKMINSYSLLLGIAGSVLALVICSRLFKPNRILNESEGTSEGILEAYRDLQLDAQEEMENIINDPVTRKEMEELGILKNFVKEVK